jgi:signal recognition particle subunit SRP54
LGTSEKADGLEVFHPDRLASRILGMGDILSLIEKAEATFDEEQARAMQEKMLANKFTLEDFLEQLQQLKRMGPLSQIMNMIPGVNRMMKDVDSAVTDKELKRVEAIIYSMTPQERRNPRLINASRKRRIARGSGTRVQDVNALLQQFRRMQRLMQSIKKGKMPDIAGMFR